jgi:hypothetical protein
LTQGALRLGETDVSVANVKTRPDAQNALR